MVEGIAFYALYKKNAILCLFLKNVLSSKRLVCFILNNLYFPVVEGIAFYALYIVSNIKKIGFSVRIVSTKFFFFRYKNMKPKKERSGNTS